MSGQGNPVVQARISALENKVNPYEARISDIENKVRNLVEAENQRKAAKQAKRGEAEKQKMPISIPEYDNAITYNKCDRVTLNGTVWQMRDAAGGPGYSPPTDGSEANNQWEKPGATEATQTCPQAGGRRASRRRQPKKKATRRR